MTKKPTGDTKLEQYKIFADQTLRDLPDPWVFVDTIPNDSNLDAIVCFEGDQHVPHSLVSASVSPLICIIYVGQNPPAWCDIHVDASAGQDLLAKLSEAADFVQQTRKLNPPKFKEEQDRLHILGLLSTRHTRLAPVADANLKTMFYYPRLYWLENTQAALESLVRNNLLSVSLQQKTFHCAQCSSARLIARETCSKCGSVDIQEDSLIHHFACGTQQAKSAFRDGAELICPKCNKQLRHFGVDYDQPSVIVKCKACDEISDDVSVNFLCGDCGESMASDGAVVKEWYQYDITSAGKSTASLGILPQRRMQELLESFDKWKPRLSFSLILDFYLGIVDRYARNLNVLCMKVGHSSQQVFMSDDASVETQRYQDFVIDLLVETLRGTDFLTSIESEIFIALPETDDQGADKAIERFKTKIENYTKSEKGVSIRKLSRKEVEDLIKRCSSNV
ncbi:hypothetical protein RAZWK3B_08571 [Roseobacter sp. AzwK-3b]|nr:hypothetical protein RAZWK3B_08571 [Roseobacter sp. AzwK-3b]